MPHYLSSMFDHDGKGFQGVEPDKKKLKGF
jgi:hypothetical protein